MWCVCVIIANKVMLIFFKKGLWHAFIIEPEPEDTFFFLFFFAL